MVKKHKKPQTNWETASATKTPFTPHKNASSTVRGALITALRRMEKKMQSDRAAMAKNYADLFCCQFCEGSRLHTCTGYDCKVAYEKAYRKGQFLFMEEGEG